MEIIEDAVQDISESIMQDKFLNKEIIIEKLKAFIPSAFKTLLQNNISVLELEATKLKKQLASGIFDFDGQLRMNKSYELGVLNDKLKQQNRAAHATIDYCDYEVLKRWVAQNWGEKKLDEFFKLQPDIKTRLFKTEIRTREKQLVNKKDRPNEIVYSTGNKTLENEKIK